MFSITPDLFLIALYNYILLLCVYRYQSNIKYYVDNLKLFVFQALRQFYFNILLCECNDILVLVSVAVGSVKSLYSAQNLTQYRI